VNVYQALRASIGSCVFCADMSGDLRRDDGCCVATAAGRKDIKKQMSVAQFIEAHGSTVTDETEDNDKYSNRQQLSPQPPLPFVLINTRDTFSRVPSVFTVTSGDSRHQHHVT